ncbi:TetR family transcriptional regulator [Kribbella voronezhensis]|uniref:TetR family transcriptional regulator n=1 Tax=Kribbella voronezhensis TaxID=2512212 RepID=A0A4R7THR1_9ACTN|nr:TetR/AcrR family transcriptional regulator C-terminal domain-containing protein [Kribbella voronezhensis]TDU91176.1 TetR family transcriptional regulator [Kribbella voronezhensis]
MNDAPYQRIAAELRSLIRTGKLKPGDRVPSTRALVRDHGVAMATATKVLALLQQERLIHPRPGIGNVVGPPPRRSPATSNHPTSTRTPPHRPPSNTSSLRTTPHPPPTADAPARPATPGRADTLGRPTAADRGSAPGSSRDDRLGVAGRVEVGEELLSRELVVRVAIGIADAEGMPALSMRRIATELGVSTMALYRYVGGKDALILQMVDTAIGDFPFPTRRPSNWRDAIEQTARLQWAAYRQHLWLPSALTVGRPQVLPKLLPHTDAVLRAVAGFGLDASTAMYAAITVFGYVRGVALNLEPEVQAEQDTGLTADEWAAHQASLLGGLVQTEDLPGFRALAIPDGFDFDFDLDQLFEFGLALVLDGLAVRLGV